MFLTVVEIGVKITFTVNMLKDRNQEQENQSQCNYWGRLKLKYHFT